MPFYAVGRKYKTAPATKMTHPMDFLVCGVLCVTVAMLKGL